MSDTSASASKLKSIDPVWSTLRQEAEDMATKEPVLGGFVHSAVLSHDTLESAVSGRVADRLDSDFVGSDYLYRLFGEMYAKEPQLAETLRVDLVAVYDRDPACYRLIDPVLYFKGFHAIQCHRLANWLFKSDRKDLAFYLQSRSSEVFQVDIHPAVPLGHGLFMDHATGIVIGGTAAIGNDVSILQNVTLGGTGKEIGDRHPKIGHGVLIGAGANVLGNIQIGHCSRVASGSVVVKPVPPNVTVAGVPAKIVGKAGCAEPSRSMNQILNGNDTDE